LLASEEFVGWCEALYKPIFDAPWQALSRTEVGA
jgi:exodeoxyribonuclease V gamma subunit